MTSSIRIPQVFPKLVGKKTRTTLKAYGRILKCIRKYALYQCIMMDISIVKRRFSDYSF